MSVNKFTGLLIISLSAANIIIFTIYRFTPLYIIEYPDYPQDNRTLYLTKEYISFTNTFKDYNPDKTIQDCNGDMICLLKVAIYSGYLPIILLLTYSFLSLGASLWVYFYKVQSNLTRKILFIVMGVISLGLVSFYFTIIKTNFDAMDHIVLKSVNITISPWIVINMIFTVIKGSALGLFWIGAAASSKPDEPLILKNNQICV